MTTELGKRRPGASHQDLVAVITGIRVEDARPPMLRITLRPPCGGCTAEHPPSRRARPAYADEFVSSTMRTPLRPSRPRFCEWQMPRRLPSPRTYVLDLPPCADHSAWRDRARGQPVSHLRFALEVNDRTARVDGVPTLGRLRCHPTRGPTATRWLCRRRNGPRGSWASSTPLLKIVRIDARQNERRRSMVRDGLAAPTLATMVMTSGRDRCVSRRT